MKATTYGNEGFPTFSRSILLVDPRDLGALKTKAAHQTLLIEREGVNAAMDGIGGEAAGHSFVHDDDTQPTRRLRMLLMLRCCDNRLGILESAS